MLKKQFQHEEYEKEYAVEEPDPMEEVVAQELERRAKQEAEQRRLREQEFNRKSSEQ